MYDPAVGRVKGVPAYEKLLLERQGTTLLEVAQRGRLRDPRRLEEPLLVGGVE